MTKVRLTKNELKRQKDSLKRFWRYLPILSLKKKQLQLEIIKIHKAIKSIAQEIDNLRKGIISWVDVFAEKVTLENYCKLKKINTTEGNVAGVDIPVFAGIEFTEEPYDFMFIPLWVDEAIKAVKEVTSLKAELLIHHKQIDILKEELRITTQRVNLFEKIKIPQAQESIRIIQIYLGELQTAAVVRGKIAKAKLERKKAVISL